MEINNINISNFCKCLSIVAAYLNNILKIDKQEYLKNPSLERRSDNLAMVDVFRGVAILGKDILSYIAEEFGGSLTVDDVNTPASLHIPVRTMYDLYKALDYIDEAETELAQVQNVDEDVNHAMKMLKAYIVTSLEFTDRFFYGQTLYSRNVEDHESRQSLINTCEDMQ